MNKTKKIASLLLASLMIIALSIFTLQAVLSSFLNSTNKLQEEKTIYFHHGSSSWDITKMLYHEKIINSKTLFYLSYKIYYHKHYFKAGEYSFIAGIKPLEVLEKLTNGFVVMHKITIPEGLIVTEIIKLVDHAPVLTGQINNLYPEGELMADTYYYLYGERKQAILEKMFKLMSQTLDKAWEERDKDLPYKNKNELLIMASIIEKEAAEMDEMKIIAGVFINRLKKNMKLQADPTVEYAITMGKFKLDRRLTNKDLKIKSPYNTYYVNKLPPTPISNPGKRAILAAASPAKHDYLYFVSNSAGRHNFSNNLLSHNKYVTDYRKKIIEAKQSVEEKK